MAATSTFQYGPGLSGREIRLLRLLPSSMSRALSLEMLQFELDSSPPFAALSYAWGDERDRKVAVCNNQTINITRSLYEALWQVRELGERCFIWADAICINQVP